ncbi:hypothetical protein M408DRAFT_332188 [Serendipita vermifera MAFF 305830]|uniref:DUF2423 domain-containing protein n=1 Tax=Serendipita vermifera MAFF 305830 TaxID=933852 RepID=A0A0C2X2M9_SERVB|nr:hypothetical protein M408DRAFT_332188 [Serendipita vermifera MAFF 305830]
MAKSTRSKSKRSFRRAKREEYEKSTYAATHAARLQRLNQKLSTIAQASTSTTSIPQLGGEEEEKDASHTDQAALALGDSPADATMDLDNGESKKISTHGRRLSRNQEWRAAKGLSVLKKTGKLNRKGELSASRKAGKSKRRR